VELTMSTVRHILLLAAVGLAAAPQERPAPDLEALRKELQAKFEALGPLSTRISHQEVDAKGAKTVACTTDLHLRMSDARLYLASTYFGDPKSPKDAFMISSGDDPLLYGSMGGGVRLDYSRYHRAMRQVSWEAGRERNKLLGEADASRTFDEYVASLQTILHAHLMPDPSATSKVHFQMSIGKGEKGGASWLQLLSKESQVEVTAGPDVVTVREAVPKRTTVIDRETGFLLSLQIDFPKGEARLVTVSKVARGTPKPEIRLPERWKDRHVPAEMAANTLAGDLGASATKTLEMVLERWDRMKSPERADAIRGYFAWYAGMQEAMHREVSRMHWASSYVKSVMEEGTKLDALARDLEDWADRLEVYVKWGEREHASTFTEYIDTLRKELLKKLAERPGSDEARKRLESLITEGFAPERVKRERPKRPAPDYVFLLRDAVEAARPAD
jgi:hypothetical protein